MHATDIANPVPPELPGTADCDGAGEADSSGVGSPAVVVAFAVESVAIKYPGARFILLPSFEMKLFTAGCAASRREALYQK